MLETLENTASIFALVGGMFSVIFAVWGVYREWSLYRKEKAEELLTSLVEDFGEHVLTIEDELGWNVVNDRKTYAEISKDMNPEQTRILERHIRKLLRRLESIAIRIHHDLLDEQMCKDYMASISVEVLKKCMPFIQRERDNRADNRIFQEFENTANRWRPA